MSFLPESFSYTYLAHEVWDKYGDQRTLPYIAGGPTGLFSVVLAYLVFVLYAGPLFMKNRKPFELRSVIKIYNLTNVALNMVFFCFGLYFTNFSLDCWGCQDNEPTDHRIAGSLRALAGMSYSYLKIFDLLDTVFFVLRKKYTQVTPLHVSHHVIMPFTCFFGAKFAPNTSSAHTMIINSFVHVIMYYYYYLAGHENRKGEIWFKKYITVVQLVQFVMAFFHASHLFFNPYCAFPRWLSFLELAESTYFMYSFSRFFIRTYMKKPKAA
ncbi:Elongation of very long chain fatty acids protein 1 [Halotydeus destructor]|nr:Elongation of very long chain fatty acids protein 1 [Halotydeus destructor]